MISINPTIYYRLADFLSEAIGSKNYFTQTITLEDEEYEYQFRSTLMVYFGREECPEATYTVISNLVAVWWEFSSLREGEEVLNDFDFNLLKRAVCN